MFSTPVQPLKSHGNAAEFPVIQRRMGQLRGRAERQNADGQTDYQEQESGETSQSIPLSVDVPEKEAQGGAELDALRKRLRARDVGELVQKVDQMERQKRAAVATQKSLENALFEAICARDAAE